ncbi:MAG: RDD family protein [Verrucomicrobiae bacterium]|nr:RDD family protein [Verrucomicrobiae bacterium]
MDFFLSLRGSKAGPFSIFKVGELLERGEVTPETLGWHRGMEEWLPISEIPALDAVRERVLAEKEDRESEAAPGPPPMPDRPPMPEPPGPFPQAPLPGTGAAPAQVLTRAAAIDPPRPFVRFFARMFDYTLISVLVFKFSAIEIVQPHVGESVADFMTRYLAEMQKPEARQFALALVFSLIGWHVLEAFLVHLLGTTPGKAIFGLRVTTNEGNRLPVLTSLGRSFYVYILGVGFYQFPFILIGMVFSIIRLLTSGACLWDQHLRTRVEGKPLGAVRILLAIGAFFVLLLLQSVSYS